MKMVKSLLAAAALAASVLAAAPAAAQTPGKSVLFSSKQGDVVFPITPPNASGSVPGTLDNTVVGSGTAAAGSFTTLGASDQIKSTAGAPSIASGNCGTGTNGSVAGTNQSGAITVGATATTTCQIDFSKTLGKIPDACVLFPGNAAAAATGTTVARVSAITAAHFIVTGSALASTVYYFFCL